MTEIGPDRSLLDEQARVPQHVVYRDFVNETVVLNLQTGTYHGLNPTAGRMLQAVERAGSIRDAAAQLATDYAWDLPTVENDLVQLCQTLVTDGLLQFQDGGPR